MTDIAQCLYQAHVLSLNPETVWIARLYRELADDLMDAWAERAVRSGTLRVEPRSHPSTT